jgi:hypothetical protein
MGGKDTPGMSFAQIAVPVLHLHDMYTTNSIITFYLPAHFIAPVESSDR